MKIVEKQAYKDYLGIAKDCVDDPADADFATLALHLSEESEKVILLTWNRRDYKDDCLETYRILVTTPSSLLK